MVDAAVAATLAFCGGHVWGAELEMEDVVREELLSGAACCEQVTIGDFSVFPVLGGVAVKEYYRVFRRLC